jgi:predicted 2-oxoglutarate/Fe(II)-dependent dioxygenase YbiX
MPTADFFCKLGVYVDRDFLAPELCAELVSSVSAAHRENSAVVDGGTAERAIKLDVRRTKTAYVSASTIATVQRKILNLKEPLQKHFSVALESF